MGTYSFKNQKGTFTGPGTTPFPIGSDAGAAKEGMTVSMVEDKDKMDTGAGGAIMHSMNASDSGTITVRLLKTSKTNQLFNQAYNFQRQNPSAWGNNQIRWFDVVRGDVVTGTELAFVKQSDLVYASEGGMNEWKFQGRINENLGSGGN